MRKRGWLVVAVAMLAAAPLGGCGSAERAATTDTTKEIYKDDEVPRVQVQVVNGLAEEIPWEKVPEASRWLFAMNDDGTYKFRVPIVRVEISSKDKEGRPVPAQQGVAVHRVVHGLNPAHTVRPPDDGKP
jgi:hypothetical protein